MLQIKKKLECIKCSVGLAGITCIKGEEGSPLSIISNEAKKYVDVRLLHRNVHISLTGISGNNSTMLLGEIKHPAGDISTLLLAKGLAKMSDWSGITRILTLILITLILIFK